MDLLQYTQERANLLRAQIDNCEKMIIRAIKLGDTNGARFYNQIKNKRLDEWFIVEYQLYKLKK